MSSLLRLTITQCALLKASANKGHSRLSFASLYNHLVSSEYPSASSRLRQISLRLPTCGSCSSEGNRCTPSGSHCNPSNNDLTIFSRIVECSKYPFGLDWLPGTVRPSQAPAIPRAPATREVPDRGTPVTKIGLSKPPAIVSATETFEETSIPTPAHSQQSGVRDLPATHRYNGLESPLSQQRPHTVT